MPLPVIAITNASTVLSDDQVKSVLPILQHQVSQDFKGYWDVECTLVWLPKDQPLIKGWWQIVVLDDPDMAGALGYHELASNGEPLGKIFAKLDEKAGALWTVTLSHELLEMLVDPWICTGAQADDGRFYALEVCDAVEADNLGYQIDGVQVSDFVTPKWFNELAGCDRYSFKKHVKKPFALAPGGYISIWDGSRWTQAAADVLVASHRELAEAAQVINVGSRRYRRTWPRATWEKSER